MRPGRSLIVAALLAVAGAAGCASSSTGSPAASAVPSGYPGASVPAASAMPARTELFDHIPAACSTVDAATLRAIAPGASAGTEYDVSGDGVEEHECNWGARAGTRWTRVIMVVVEIETGGDARVNAAGEYQNEYEDDTGLRPVTGFGDKAEFSDELLKTVSYAKLHILQQNVVMTVMYGGADAGGPMGASELSNGWQAVAHSVLAAVG